MSAPLRATSLRLSPRASAALQAIAEDCQSCPGRVASELMELALTGRARPANARSTRKMTGSASSEAMAVMLAEQQGRVLASLRAAVADKAGRR